jgi:hypothetical protein
MPDAVRNFGEKLGCGKSGVKRESERSGVGHLPRGAERVLLVVAGDVTWLDEADAAVVGFVVRRVTDGPMSSRTLPDSAAA